MDYNKYGSDDNKYDSDDNTVEEMSFGMINGETAAVPLNHPSLIQISSTSGGEGLVHQPTISHTANPLAALMTGSSTTHASTNASTSASPRALLGHTTPARRNRSPNPGQPHELPPPPRVAQGGSHHTSQPLVPSSDEPNDQSSAMRLIISQTGAIRIDELTPTFGRHH
ncbi:hypothetical protein FRC11_011515 [Ceratobasidium sp. 423]|nr:hypothetical protein FRC11_011515 [Ceratobasidium sp. 423]